MTLRHYHAFEHDGGRYVINADRVSAHVVSEAVWQELVGQSRDPDCALRGETEQELRRLGLVASDNKPPGTTARAGTIPIQKIALFVTQTCNLNCVYCYGNGGTYGSEAEMSPVTARRAIDWLIEQSGEVRTLFIGFFGGEPLLNFPLMKHVMEYAETAGARTGKEFEFGVTTNASLLDDETIAFLVAHGVKVRVSFDGPKEIQDAQRPFKDGTGTYGATVPKLKKVLAALPQTPCRTTLVGDTDPARVRQALFDLGFRKVSIVPVSASLFDPEPGPGATGRDLAGLISVLECDAAEWLEHARRREIESLKRSESSSSLMRWTEVLGSFVNGQRRHFACGAGRSLAGVSCSGDVFLCHRFVGSAEHRLGSIFGGELDREEYQRSPARCVERCSSCFAKYVCGGGCKHNNAGTSGSAFEPAQDMCRLVRRTAELAAYTSCMLNEADKAFLVKEEIIPRKLCPLDF